MPKRKTSETLVQAFAKRITDGSWVPGHPIPPVRALAALFNVARATMDTAVREGVEAGLLTTVPRQATCVADDAVSRAASVLEELKRCGRRVRIAVLTADGREARQPEDHDRVIAEVVAQARKSGWTASVVYWPLSRQSGFPRFLTDRDFDGAFCVAGRSEHLMSLYFMRQRHFPIVIYDRRFANLPLPTVTFDRYRAVQRLGKMLYTLGHRRIALLAAAGADSPVDNPQLNGWLDFCRQNNLLGQWDEPIYLVGHLDMRQAVRAYFRRRPRPTAVIFGSADLAQRFLEMDGLGVRVPGDLSLACAHGRPQHPANSDLPEVTCMEPNMQRMAECSMEMLARMINGEPYPPPLRLPCALIRTDSIDPPATDKD